MFGLKSDRNLSIEEHEKQIYKIAAFYLLMIVVISYIYVRHGYNVNLILTLRPFNFWTVNQNIGVGGIFACKILNKKSHG